jgi:hypothetical protein
MAIWNFTIMTKIYKRRYTAHTVNLFKIREQTKIRRRKEKTRIRSRGKRFMRITHINVILNLRMSEILIRRIEERITTNRIINHIRTRGMRLGRNS